MILYSEPNCLIHLELKNNTDSDVVITRVSYLFETETNLPKNMVPTTQYLSIRPNCNDSLTIPFQVGLALCSHTNRPTFEVEYKVDGSVPKTITFDKNKVNCYAIIQPIPCHQRDFFISHRDPIDTEKAKKLDYYLKKIGFNGYIAEENRQPGLHLWDEKIIPQIKNCMGLIVMWTAEAAQKPEIMCKEIEYAQKQGSVRVLYTRHHDAIRILLQVQ